MGVVKHEVGSQTLIVAASDAPSKVRARADYICDGTDDDVQIQAALDALSQGTVLLTEGTYTIGASIEMRTKKGLIGIGISTVLQSKNSLDDHVIDNSSGSLQYFCILRDFRVVGNDANNTTGDCVHANMAHTWWMENLHLDDGAGRGIDISGDASNIALNNHIINCRIENSATQGLFVSSFAPNNHIVGNIIGGTDDWYGIECANDENIFVDNHIHSTSNSGVLVSGENNKFIGNIVESSGSHGFDISGDHNKFIGNTAFNNTNDGFNVNADYNVFQGNRAFDRQGAKTQDYGFDIQSGADNNIFVGNVALAADHTTGSFNDGGSNNQFFNNQDYATNNVINDLKVGEAAYFDAEYDNGNSGAADTIDWGNGNKQKSTLTDNATFTFTNPGGACNVVLNLVQDGTGSRNPTWPASVKWAGGSEPTWSTGAGAIDIVSFYFDGTNYYGAANIGFS